MEPGAPRGASDNEMTADHKGTILVVDDDRLVLATLAHGLTQAGYDVIDADNGDDAILLAREHRPDLALLDIRMQGKSGFDVAEYLRQYCHIPFMFLSAFSDEATVAQVKTLGAVAYLVKPLDIAQILPSVATALAHVAASRQATALAGGPGLGHSPEQLQWMAVGLLMQRETLAAEPALQHLQQLAVDAGRPVVEVAVQLLGAAAQPAAG
jgi:two-component system, response regulator PdtaR